jgi:flagellar hook assembly protein FlgD
MDIYTRVENLEKNFDALIKQMNNTKFYTDADISGTRKSIAETEKHINDTQPYIATQSASYGDTSVTFEDVPQGIISVNIVDSEGESISPFYKREGNDVIVGFAPLDYAADVTISIQ